MKILFLILSLITVSAFAQRREMFKADTYKFGKTANLLTANQLSFLSGLSSNLQEQLNLLPVGRATYDAFQVGRRIFPIHPFTFEGSEIAAVGGNPVSGSLGVFPSPDGQYVAMLSNACCTTDTVPVRFYEKQGSSLALLTAPASVAAQTSDGAWSPDGRFFVVTIGVSPWYRVFERGINNSTFTLLAAPTALASAAQSVAWHPDGRFLIFAHNNSFTIVQRSLTNTFATVGTQGHTHGISWRVRFSPSGKFLALGTLGGASGKYFAHYKVNLSTLTIALSEASTGGIDPIGQVFGVCYSPDESVVVSVGDFTTISPYVIDPATGDLSRIDDPDALHNGTGRGCAFSPDGKKFVYVQAPVSYEQQQIWIYNASGTSPFTYSASESTLVGTGTTQTAYTAEFSPSGRTLYVGINSVGNRYLILETSAPEPLTKGRTPLIKKAGGFEVPLWY